MPKPLNNGKPLPRNAVAVYTLENGWEYLPHLVAERDRFKAALEKIQSVVGVGTTAARLANDALAEPVEIPFG